MANAAQVSSQADERPLPAGFEPETVLASQFFDKSHLGASLQPEKRLMLAVLEDAVATIQRGASRTNGEAGAEFVETRDWFASDDVVWPYSFVNICHALGLEPAYILGGIDRLLAAARARVATGKVVPFRYAFRRISGSRTRAVVPRRERHR